jgi:hypothetical protein
MTLYRKGALTALEQLLREQDRVATRLQLRICGLTDDLIKAQLRALRWRALNETAISTHNGPLTASQGRWAVVLSAQDPAALCGLTAMSVSRVTGFETAAVHVLVVRGAKLLAVRGVDVVVHESRRFSQLDVVSHLPPTTSLERATIDAAVWSPDPRTAARIVVAPIQQRKTTAPRLLEELARTKRVRHRAGIAALLADLVGGAEALSEVEFLRWCRRHGFPVPHLQVRVDSLGRRRYLDAVFRRADGSLVYVEVDGGVHLSLTTRWLDTSKDNDAALAGQLSLRFPSVAIYTDDAIAVRQMRAALQQSVRPSGRPSAASV